MAKPAKPVLQYVGIERMAASFERSLRVVGRSENTIYSYGLSVRLLTEWLEAHDRPVTVNVARDDIESFLVEQRTRRTITDNMGRSHVGGSGATALVRFKSLQAFFKYVVEREELDVSPMVGIKAPETVDRPPAIVDDDVVRKLLAARKGKSMEERRDAALLRVFFDTGCRLSEVAGLRINDVDMKHQDIRVTGKGDRVRVIPFGNNTYLALEGYLLALERAGKAEEWLWIGRYGRMSTSGISDILHRVCDDAGLPRLHWHQFRHTFAHSWLVAGNNEGDLVELAGWRSRTMVDVYARSAKVQRAHDAKRRTSLGDRL
jgi:site-specific recombinase XerD